MVWFKVDDKLWGSSEWLATSSPARALYCTAGSWCGDQLTNGEIPRHVLQILGGRPKDAAELVARGYWRATETGWEFVGWLADQPSKEQVLAEREAGRQRQARAREAARQKREAEDRLRHEFALSNGGSNGVTSPVTAPASNGPPDPTRPDPTRLSPTEKDGTPKNVSAASPPDPALIPTEALPSKQPTEPDRFEEFWAAYPKKRDKAEAHRKWQIARRKVSQDCLISAAVAYRDDPQRDPNFTKDPPTWLHRGSWENQPEPAHRPSPNGKPTPGQNGAAARNAGANVLAFIGGMQTNTQRKELE